MDDLKIKQFLTNTYNAFQRYTDYRFDYIIRRSLNQIPEELNFDEEYSVFDPTQKFLITCISNGNHENDIIELKSNLKSLRSEINSKRNDVKLINQYEDGLMTNIKKLESIISVKETITEDNVNHEKIRCNAKEKVFKEYNKIHTKYHKILNQYEKSNKPSKTKSTNETSKQTDYLSNKIEKYEEKLKTMNDVLQIANDNKNKLLQHEAALQVSRDRLNVFYDQLNEHIKNKKQLSSALMVKEKQIKQLKITLSNLEVVSSVEKSRLHTSSNFIEDNNIKKEFLNLRNLRTDVLNSRPKGMFNPKYQKNKHFTKEQIRKYLENDETIDSIDYLIELKNKEKSTKLNSLKYNQTLNSNETNIFVKCLSVLSEEDIKKLLINYFMKYVDLRESERENEDLIAELDESVYRHKRSIISINNDFQEFHLSIEKKFTLLKNNYQQKLNSLYTLLQEENNAITVYRMRQEISSLKKKIVELEKEKLQIAKSKEVHVKQRKSMDHLEASKSGSDVVSSARVTLHKNKLKIQKKLSKLTS